MNQYANTVIRKFTSKPNKERLFYQISEYFSDDTATRYLAEYFEGHIGTFVQSMESEMSMSDPLPGVTVDDQVSCFNRQFTRGMLDFMSTHVYDDDKVAQYVIRDGMPTSRHGLRHHQSAPQDILASWASNPSRSVQLRSDDAGDLYQPAVSSGGGGCEDTGISTGIAFCDQSRRGINNHMVMYEDTPYKRALNRAPRPHEQTPFGVSTPASDARLLSRNIFRKNEQGVSNGVPLREVRLHRRNLDWNMREGLREEKDCKLYGHDMSSLSARVNHRNAVRDRYAPPIDTELRLQYH